MIVDSPEIMIAVMGATGSGKTTFLNVASSANLQVGGGLQSCTNSVQMAQPFMLSGRSVTLIDTPGFDDTTKSDSDILRMIAAFLATNYENGKKLAGVIYIHRISDIRMSGISTRNFKMFRQLCGDSTLQNVVILTNMWGEVTREIGEAREAELASQDIFFKPVLEKGALLLRHENTTQSAHAVLQHIIQNRPLPLQIQRELVDEKKDISGTAAGVELNNEMMLQIEKHRREMEALQEATKEAIRIQEEQTKHAAEAEAQRIHDEMIRAQSEAQRLAAEHIEEQRRLDRQMQAQAELARQEAERAAAEHARQQAEFQAHLNRVAAEAVAQQQELERQRDALQRSHQDDGGICCIA
ncbi:P-loop containing nucleoside triphosphate hydrolase protein [Pholiota molesta]|nr:P-loop containing nucleoside triphosphate hydrolase protein [Pholiota molesta]